MDDKPMLTSTTSVGTARVRAAKVRIISWLVAVSVAGLVLGPSVARADLTIVHEVVVTDLEAGTSKFTLVFNRPPDFFTLDGAGRQADAFQYFIMGDRSLDYPDGIATVIRGGEIHATGTTLAIRQVSLPSSDPGSGGWGEIVAQVPFELDGVTMSFSVDTALLTSNFSETGGFYYTVFVTEYGGTTDFKGRLGIDSSHVVSIIAPTTSVVAVQEILENDGHPGGLFGVTVAVDGDTAVIGSTEWDIDAYGPGAAYVFTQNASGLWIEQARLVPHRSLTFQNFGCSVAIEGNTVVVGTCSYGADPETGDLAAYAYVFVRDSSGNWIEQARLTAGDGEDFDGFGNPVGISGDTVVVGNSIAGCCVPVEKSGAVYVFTRDSSDDWTELTRLVPHDSLPGDSFGSSIDIDEDIAIIGRPRDDENGPDAGSAYVFAENGPNLWQERQKLMAGDTNSQRFGNAVAVNKNTIVVGAKGDTTLGTDGGAAYVYQYDGSENWIEVAKLLPGDGDTLGSSEFGFSVDVHQNVIGIGAPSYAVDDNGSAYLFGKDIQGQWIEQARLRARDDSDDDHFGSSIAVNSDAVIAGSPGDDHKGVDSGSAYSFSLSAIIPEPYRFISVPVLGAVQGELYTYAIDASDPDTDGITISAPVIPDWLVLVDNGDGTAELSGTPGAADVGVNQVTLVASDPEGSSMEQSFAIDVAATPIQPPRQTSSGGGLVSEIELLILVVFALLGYWTRHRDVSIDRHFTKSASGR